jgi:hypothetical protein
VLWRKGQGARSAADIAVNKRLKQGGPSRTGALQHAFQQLPQRREPVAPRQERLGEPALHLRGHVYDAAEKAGRWRREGRAEGQGQDCGRQGGSAMDVCVGPLAR